MFGKGEDHQFLRRGILVHRGFDAFGGARLVDQAEAHEHRALDPRGEVHIVKIPARLVDLRGIFAVR